MPLSQVALRELLTDAINQAITAGPTVLDAKVSSPGGEIAKGDAISLRAVLRPPARVTVEVPDLDPLHVLPRYSPVLKVEVDPTWLTLIGGQTHLSDAPSEPVVAEGVCADTREDALRARLGSTVGSAVVGSLERIGVALEERVLHWQAEVYWTVESRHVGSGSATPCRRAARLVVRPMARYSSLESEPRRPSTTGPDATPARTSRPSCSPSA